MPKIEFQLGIFWRHMQNRKVIKTLANLIFTYSTAVFWEHGKELSSSVKVDKFPKQLSSCKERVLSRIRG
jgi:hypothetical protein